MSASEKPLLVPMRVGLQPLPLDLDLLKSYDAIIDVRSPSEYAEDHLPGAVNYPVLDDQERTHVGTLYKQTSAFEAKKVGAALVARNIALHIESAFLGFPKQWRPLIYCWRGGSRSGAMAHILRSIGWQAFQLDGGYKAWRRQVTDDLSVLPEKFSYRVICGRTGSGKSRLLFALGQDGRQVLDLEGLAAHRGSVLGDLPGEPQPSQKYFESCIWQHLSQFDPTRPVFVEAESKKVGRLRVPERLIERMRESPCIEVDTPHSLRVRLLCEEYDHLITDNDLLFAKLDCLKELHSTARIDAWKSLAMSRSWDAFVADMLVDHYDPAYARSMFKNYVHAGDATVLPVNDISTEGFLNLARALPH